MSSKLNAQYLRLILPVLLGLSLQTKIVLAAQTPDIIVQTPLGKLRGNQNVDTGVNEFKGIPYAKAKRFDNPVPQTSWSSIRDASKFGSNCPQAARFDLTEESLSEDCLFLNVSAPSDLQPNEILPVMVWISGGGFVGGGSNLYRLDRLTQEARIVVVSLNYRMGMFGFMPRPAMHAETNGNLGQEDQREALRGVQKNISTFGGNPKNITVAGESAGSGSICQHLACPQHVSGLFQKALLISGACLQELPTVQQALEQLIWQAISYMMNGGARNELRLYVAYDVLGDNANNTKYPVTLDNVNHYYMPAFYGSDQKMNQIH